MPEVRLDLLQDPLQAVAICHACSLVRHQPKVTNDGVESAQLQRSPDRRKVEEDLPHGVEMARLSVMVVQASLQEAGTISQGRAAHRPPDVELAGFPIIPNHRGRGARLRHSGQEPAAK
jgi:hypothetical protein